MWRRGQIPRFPLPTGPFPALVEGYEEGTLGIFLPIKGPGLVTNPAGVARDEADGHANHSKG